VLGFVLETVLCGLDPSKAVIGWIGKVVGNLDPSKAVIGWIGKNVGNLDPSKAVNGWIGKVAGHLDPSKLVIGWIGKVVGDLNPREGGDRLQELPATWIQVRRSAARVAGDCLQIWIAGQTVPTAVD